MISSHRTAEEAKADHLRLMGEELGRTYDALWQQVAWVHGKWSDYVDLFGTKESRIELLNQAAPAFFRLVEDSLWENVLLHIARLTDPPATGRKQNLTLQRLPELIDRQEIKTNLNEKLQVAVQSSAFARDWRNRHIAHNDLELKISTSATPLEFASRKCVNDSLAAFSDVLNVIAAGYLDSTTFFDTLDGDATSLLYVLDDGIRAERERREKLRNGIYDPDQFKPRDL